MELTEERKARVRAGMVSYTLANAVATVGMADAHVQ